MSSHQHQVQQYIACLLYTARNSILNALSISLYMVVAGPFAHDMPESNFLLAVLSACLGAAFYS